MNSVVDIQHWVAGVDSGSRNVWGWGDTDRETRKCTCMAIQRQGHIPPSACYGTAYVGHCQHSVTKFGHNARPCALICTYLSRCPFSMLLFSMLYGTVPAAREVKVNCLIMFNNV